MTLRPQIPPAPTPVLQGPMFSRHWYRFLQQLWESLGWNPARPVYNELYQSAFSTETNASSVEIAGDVFGMEAPDSADTFFNFSFRLPKDYKSGSDIVLFADWLNISSSSGDVVWKVVYGVGGALSENYNSDHTEAAGDQLVSTTSEFTTISGSEVSSGDTIIGAITRRGSAADDTLSASVVLLGIGIKYRVEGAGKDT